MIAPFPAWPPSQPSCSLPLAAGNLLPMLATVHFNLNGMTNPLVLLHAGTAAAPLWRWSMILDIFGYYLPIVPLILLLRSSLRHQSPNWIDLFVLCLLAYCLIGAIGGAVLATALPTLIREYASATSGSHQVGLQMVFTGYTDGVYRGLWNLLEGFWPVSAGLASASCCGPNVAVSA